MMSRNRRGRVVTWRSECVRSVALLLLLAGFSPPAASYAICGLDSALYSQVQNVQNVESARTWVRRLTESSGYACSICHVSSFAPRTSYGAAINLLITGLDREDTARKRAAGQRVSELPANPALPNSPTFGDLIQQGLPPSTELTPDLIASLNLLAQPSEQITVERARELVRQVQSESRFGILQLSRTPEITADVAAALAQFRGEMLILGLKTLTPEVAQALAKSQVATVWLHSVTSVTPEVAEWLSQVRGELVMSGLVELDSLPLAEKLARRPAALAFPYLKQVTVETAAALARSTRSLNLGSMSEPSREIQDKLAEAAGPLVMPALTSLESMPLTKKLAAGYSQSVLLPALRTLTVEQAQEIVSFKRNYFWGGSYLPLSVMSEDVASVFEKNPAAGRLVLGSGAISEPAFKILVQSQLSIEMSEIELLNDEQIKILSTAASTVPGGPFGSRTKIIFPKLKRLDSPLLAVTLLRSSSGFGNVTTISPEVAAALATASTREARNPDGSTQMVPRSLSFSSLQELPIETAQRLCAGPWSGISLPGLREVSPETVRLLVAQPSFVQLGVTSLSPAAASAFSYMARDPVNLGGGIVIFPYLTELSPEAARNLVGALNRGSVSAEGGLDRAPQLFLGGRLPMGLSPRGTSPPLTPELTAALAQYRGRLSISGLQELSPQAAAELAVYRGWGIELSGPAIEQIPAATAAALATFPGKLQPQLRVLDSVPLAEKLGRQSSQAVEWLEVISPEAIGPYTKSNGFFRLRQLGVLDSPALAQRLIQDSTGQTMPSLQQITPAAAEVLATSPNAVFLGLRVLTDPAVVRALAKANKGASLPRLRAASPSVIGALGEAKSIQTPPLESLYVVADGPGG
ncbi:MAG: hypothetical protein ACKOBW_09410 [Planctomycetota bacterium]